MHWRSEVKGNPPCWRILKKTVFFPQTSVFTFIWFVGYIKVGQSLRNLGIHTIYTHHITYQRGYAFCLARLTPFPAPISPPRSGVSGPVLRIGYVIFWSISRNLFGPSVCPNASELLVRSRNGWILPSHIEVALLLQEDLGFNIHFAMSLLFSKASIIFIRLLNIVIIWGRDPDLYFHANKSWILILNN